MTTALVTIEDARHLEGFIRDYARFAKLPSPPRSRWIGRFLDQLRRQVDILYVGVNLGDTSGDNVAGFDAA